MDRTLCVRCASADEVIAADITAGGAHTLSGAVNSRSRTVTMAPRTRPTNHAGAAHPSARLRQVPGKAPPAPALPAATVPPAAAAPDAAPRRADHVVRAALHGVVLLAVVGFVVAYCVVIPLRRQLTARAESATVMLVADPLAEVRAPDASGVFRATRPLPHGARVRRGDLLGRIESPRLEEDIEQASVESRGLQARLLRLERRALRAEPSAQEVQEARELASRLEAVDASLARLEAQRSRLAVYAPADGVVQDGLAAAVAVLPHQSIVSLFPDEGRMVLEVSAPLDVLTTLQRSGRLSAAFETPQGTAMVTARLLTTSLRHSKRKSEAGLEETWGTVQCVPESLPAPLRSPGLIGRLAPQW